jgi:two-component system, NtrC family, sensor histidine kinase PilS
LAPRPNRGWPWMPTVGLDSAVFATLEMLEPGGLNYSLLFALPVLMAATLGPQQRALGMAAWVTLYLLGDASWTWWTHAEESTARFLQTAITGTGYFLMALLARQLAVRLAREEALAETSQQVAKTQAEVNALVIEALNDGVLVVDRALRVWANNPAARRLLGELPASRPNAMGETPPSSRWADSLAHIPHLAPLVGIIQNSLQRQQPLVHEMEWRHADQHQLLRVRTHPMTGLQDNDTGPACVVFLDDLHELDARVRSEKLAGMGRMTVAVAHEIRNPLAAISQASQLLHEELQDPMHQRLGQMIEQNTRRLNRIVEDVLDVVRVPGRAAADQVAPMRLDESVRATLDEWCGQHACTTRLVLTLGAPTTWVRFDAEHLRRVMINLLDNAHRYASMSPGAIQVETRLNPTEPEQVRLSVWSDGAPLEPGILRHLFEPFFSSESRSSGMGLYLCRELCDRYQSRLDYQRSPRGSTAGNEFFVSIPICETGSE